MVVDPLLALEEGVVGCRLVVFDAVHVPDDAVGLPLDGEGVEGVGHGAGEVVEVAVALAARVAGAVERAEDPVGQPADILHDVDLAGLRPVHLVDVGTKHPEGRPVAGASRHLDSGLDPAVGNLEAALREQAGRGVLAGAVVALKRSVGRLDGDRQVALAVAGRILPAVGVVLKLVVAPAGIADRDAVADLVAPHARVGRGACAAVELIAPDERILRRVGQVGVAVGQLDCDVLAGALALVPEGDTRAAAPVLADREVAAELDALIAPRLGDLEHALVGALARDRVGGAGGDLRVAQDGLAVGRPEVGVALEVVDHGNVIGLIVEDGHARDRRDAQRRAAGGVAQRDLEAALALVLGVVDGGHREGLVGDTGGEAERARNRREVAIRHGGAEARDAGVVHRDCVEGCLAELGGHRGDAALGDRVADGGEADGERAHRGDAVQLGVIDVVGLGAGGRGDRAEGPAVDLVKAKTIVGGAVADVLAVHGVEGQFDQLPAAEVVDDVD